MLVHDRLLPRLEHDRPCVLATRAVLREDFRPALPRAFDADAAMHTVRPYVGWAAGRNDLDGDRAVNDELRVRAVARDDELERPMRGRHAAIAEVPAQQERVGPRISRPPHDEHMFASTSDGSAAATDYNDAPRGDWSNGEDGGLQNRKSGFDSLVPRWLLDLME